MDNRNVLFGLHESEGIGWKTILPILQHVPVLNEILSFNVKDYCALNVPLKKAELLAQRLTESFIYSKLETYRRAGIHFITIMDDDYPEMLKQTSQPPWVLYYRGDFSLLKKPGIAIVGTRTPTAYGKRVTETLAGDLSQYGFCIVSGLAKGIDSEAHKGALFANGATAAVLGTGIDSVYPPENASLYKQICEKGVVLSEYPIGTKSHPGMFPQRNRIIAGLTLGTVVVEAALASGSLITVDQALEESRDVFAIPGPITSPKSQGTLSLIKQGAKMVTSVKDIVEEYKQQITNLHTTYIKQEQPGLQLNKDEQFVYRFLTNEPTSIDRLLEETKFDFGHLHSVLLSLLLKNKIVQQPGSTYITI